MKDFDVARREEADQPIQFKLGGQTFTCAALYPAATYLERVNGTPTVKLLPFMEGCMESQEYARFVDRLRSVKDPIDTTHLIDVVEWLITEYAARPTRRPSASAPGPSTTTDASSWRPDASGSVPSLASVVD